MAEFVETITGRTTAGLQGAVNAFLATLTNHLFSSISIAYGDVVAASGFEVSLSFRYDDGGSVLANPFRTLVYQGATADAVDAQLQSFIDANPSYFVSAPYLAYLPQTRRTSPYVLVAFYNVDSAASDNFPGGGAGGPTNAVDVSLADTEDHYPTDNAEAAFQRLGRVVTDTQEPNGFVDTTTADKTLTWDAVANELTIAPTGADFEFYVQGTRYSKSAADTVALSTAVEGLHVAYYDDTGTLNLDPIGSSPGFAALFTDVALVAFIVWDATNLEIVLDVFREEHGIVMDGDTHRYNHLSFGAQYRSGLALEGFTLGDGSLDTHAQFGVEAGRIADEDVDHDIPDILSTTGLPVIYLDGPEASPNSRNGSPTAGFSVLNTGSGRLAWNELSGGTWGLSEVQDGYYVCYHVFATNSNTPSLGVFAVPGQGEFETELDAIAAARSEVLNLTTVLLEPELRPIGSVILQTDSTFANAVQARVVPTVGGNDYEDWREVEFKEDPFDPNPVFETVTAQEGSDFARLVGQAGPSKSGGLLLRQNAGSRNFSIHRKDDVTYLNHSGDTSFPNDGQIELRSASVTVTVDQIARQYGSPVVTLGSDTISIDMSAEDGSNFRRTTAGNVTLNEPTNLLDGSVIVIEFTQGGTVGSPHTITFSGVNWTFTGGIEPDLSPAPGSVDRAYIRRVDTAFEVMWVATDGDPAYQFGNQVSLPNSVATVLDTFPVDDFRGADWTLYFEDTTNGDYAKLTAQGYHDGTPAADATTTVDDGGSGLSFAALGFTVATDVSGAGTSQVMRLLATAPATGVWTASFERLAGGPQ